MHLPVAAREIRVAAHDPAHYRGRVWTGALAIGVTIWILYGALEFTGRFNYSVGAQIFAIQAWIAFVFAAGTMQITNDSISREKREGTLGLLFLTHLKGHDIVLGKLTSSMLLHFSAALATLPVLTLPTLLGGVQFMQSFQLILSLLNCMFFSAAVGLLASTLCVNRQRAGSLAILIVVIFCAILPLITFSMTRKGIYPEVAFALDFISPFFAQRLSPGALIGPQKTYFYVSLGIVFLLSCAFLTAASLIAPHSWQMRESRPLIGRIRKKLAAWADQTIKSRSPLGQRLLDANPYEWLAARRQNSRVDGWIYIGSTVAIAAALILHFNSRFDPANVQIMVCIPAAVLLILHIKTRVGGHACDRFCEDRESNALELILSTPMTVPEMIAGEFRALKRLFFKQALLTLALLFLGLFLSIPGIDRLYENFNADGTHMSYRIWGALIVCWLSFFLFFDCVTLAWVGIWLSFRLRSIQHVRGNTMAIVFAGPVGVFCAVVAIIENSPLRSIIRGASSIEIVVTLAFFAIGGNIWLIRKSRNYLLQTGNDSLSKHQFFTREFPNPFAFVLSFLRRGPAR